MSSSDQPSAAAIEASQRESLRRLTAQDLSHLRPVHAVWEITLACDLKCTHCGSRAAKARPQELSTQECLDLIDQLADMGCREVTLIGGEAYLRADWTTLIAAIVSRGMYCAVQTGARNLTPARQEAAWAAGLRHVGVSIDGLDHVHDRQRGVVGSFARATDAIRRMRARGFKVTVNSQLNALTVPQLEAMLALLVELGVERWQLQLTVAMGRATQQPELLLQPFELLTLIPRLAQLIEDAQAQGVLIQPGNNIGFFGPWEEVIRRHLGQPGVHWSGCTAGVGVLGIEADGTLKGCPSLTTQEYAAGNIRQASLDQAWQHPRMAFARERSRADLTGFCQSCYYADVCQAGCTWTHQVLTGQAGDNPLCHHRALTLAELGLRERLHQLAPAPGQPFDRATWAIILERLDGSPLEPQDPRALDPAGPSWPRQGLGQSLIACSSCRRFMHPDHHRCPFCQAARPAADEAALHGQLGALLLRAHQRLSQPAPGDQDA